MRVSRILHMCIMVVLCTASCLHVKIYSGSDSGNTMPDYRVLYQKRDVPQPPRDIQLYNDMDFFYRVVSDLIQVAGNTLFLDMLPYNIRLNTSNLNLLRDWLAFISRQANYYDPQGDVAMLQESMRDAVGTVHQLIEYMNDTKPHLEKEEWYKHLIAYLKQQELDVHKAARFVENLNILPGRFIPDQEFVQQVSWLLLRFKSIDQMPDHVESFHSEYYEQRIRAAQNTFVENFVRNICQRRHDIPRMQIVQKATPSTYTIPVNADQNTIYDVMQNSITSALHVFKGNLKLNNIQHVMYDATFMYGPLLYALASLVEEYDIFDTQTAWYADQIRMYLTAAVSHKHIEFETLVNGISWHDDPPYVVLQEIVQGVPNYDNRNLPYPSDKPAHKLDQRDFEEVSFIVHKIPEDISVLKPEIRMPILVIPSQENIDKLQSWYDLIQQFINEAPRDSRVYKRKIARFNATQNDIKNMQSILKKQREIATTAWDTMQI